MQTWRNKGECRYVETVLSYAYVQQATIIHVEPTRWSPIAPLQQYDKVAGKELPAWICVRRRPTLKLDYFSKIAIIILRRI